jgi:alkaline phosphatase
MARYVDGFVIAVPKKKVGAYLKMARLGAKVWKDHGALEYYECVGDDFKAQFGAMPFPKLVRLAKSETVVFSWIVYRSKKHRDSVNAKVMKDPRLNNPDLQKSMPFDMKRMAYGGFKTLVYW